MSQPKHSTSRLAFYGFILVISVSLACNTPLNTVNQQAVGTSAAQTITAEYDRQTETALAGPTNTASPIPTQVQPTATNTMPATVPIPATETPVPPPGAPTILASEDTNCRVGPAPEYQRLGYLLKGESSTVVGKNSQNNWWYIQNPRNPGQNCWVWNQTTSVTGEIAGLPIITPPPSPVGQNPSFAAFFTGVNSCGGPAMIFQVQNTGDATFKSMKLTIEDRTLAKVVHSSTRNSPFFTNPGICPGGKQNLEPGQAKYIGGVVENFVNSGDSMGAQILLCTESGLSGRCLDTYITFAFP